MGLEAFARPALPEERNRCWENTALTLMDGASKKLEFGAWHRTELQQVWMGTFLRNRLVPHNSKGIIVGNHACRCGGDVLFQLNAMLASLTRIFGLRLPSFLLKLCLMIGIGLGVLLYVNYKTIQEYLHTRERLDNYRESVEILKDDHQDLLQEKAALEADGFDKEKAIRERLNMIKPGEKVIYIEPPESARATPLPEP